MKIVISNQNSGEIYETIEDPTSAQMVAYLGSHIIEIDGADFFVESTSMNHNTQTLSILVEEDADEYTNEE